MSFSFRKTVAAAVAALAIPCACFAGARIEINLPAHSLSVYEDGVKTHEYPVAIGKYSTPTPTGEFSVIDMGEDPVWVDPETMEVVESGDWNPLGYRWIGFYGRYGIHGNNNPGSIGTSVSNGCVRMYEEDVEELYEIVDVGTPVDIVYDRFLVMKDADNQVAFYVFPDVYDEKGVSVDEINAGLNSYGVAPFVSDDKIEAAIEVEDGEPVWVAGVTPIFVDGKEIAGKVVSFEEVDYFPVSDLAAAAGVNVSWDGQNFSSSFGSVPGTEFKGVAFSFNWQDVEKLLNMKVRVEKRSGVYHVLPPDKALVVDYAAAQEKANTEAAKSNVAEADTTVATKANVGKASGTGVSEKDFEKAVGEKSGGGSQTKK